METEIPSSELYIRYKRNGCQAAFAELHTRYSGRLVAWLAKSFAQLTSEQVDDAAQETWLRVAEDQSFRNESSFSTWLHKLARFRALKSLRYRRRRPESPLVDGIDVEYLDARVDADDDEIGVDDLVEAAARRTERRLMSCCRDAIDCKIVQMRAAGRRDKEIAVAVDLTRAAVCHRRKAIRQRFERKEAALQRSA